GRRGKGDGQLGGDSQLSRRHALLTRAGARLTIADLGSTNGTRVNGTLITERVELRAGDRVELGGSTLEVRGSGPAEDIRGATQPLPAGSALAGSAPAARASGGGGSAEPIRPFAAPPVDRDDARRGRRAYEVGLVVLAVAAVVAVVVLLV